MNFQLVFNNKGTVKPPGSKNTIKDISGDDIQYEESNGLSFVAGNKSRALTLKQILPDVKLDIQLLPWPSTNYLTPPSTASWSLLPIYTVDQKKKERLWQIGYDAETNQLTAIHGQVGGKIQTHPVEVIIKGGKTRQEQAWQDAKAKYLEKWRKGYHVKGDNSVRNILAQRGPHYRAPGMKKMHSDDTSKAEFPVLVDAKLDGIRVRVFMENGQPVAYTGRNVRFSFFEKHLEDIGRLFAYLPPNVGLDGEWYNHKMSLQEISGISRRSVNRSYRADQIKMYIFDIIVPETILEERYAMLMGAYKAYLEDGYKNEYFHLLGKSIAYNPEDVLSYHDQYVGLGYEGAIIRKLAGSISKQKDIIESYYRGKKNKSLLKVKSFREEEVTVIGIYCGVGKEKDLAIFTVRDKNGKTFDVRPCGSYELREAWYKNPEKCLDRSYTIKFYERTPDGIPFHARGKGFRDKIGLKGVLDY